MGVSSAIRNLESFSLRDMRDAGAANFWDAAAAASAFIMVVLDTDSRPYMESMSRMDARLSVAKNMNTIAAMRFGPGNQKS